jgi:hypothetical protein
MPWRVPAIYILINQLIAGFFLFLWVVNGGRIKIYNCKLVLTSK